MQFTYLHYSILFLETMEKMIDELLKLKSHSEPKLNSIDPQIL